MPPKRRRADGKEDREDSPGLGHTKKKRKVLNYDPHAIISELYETIRNHKSEDGRLLCEAFIRVPKRRTAADYYEVVTTPIDLLKIQQKVKTDGYDYVDQLTADVVLMLNNAKAYYKRTSQEYKDACDLLELYEVTRAELVEAVFGNKGDKTSQRTIALRKASIVSQEEDESEELADEDEDDDEADDDDGNEEDENDDDEDEEEAAGRNADGSGQGGVSDEVAEDLEQLFGAVVTTKDGDRDISQAFQLLPPRAKYPQYYEVIKNAIDLKTIATKIQSNAYKNLDELEKDLLLMVKNAKTFNEPKSLIYRDAVTLKKIISERKRELEYRKSGQSKTSGRLRTKDRTLMQKMSAVCAALKYQESSEDGNSVMFDIDSDIQGDGNDLVEDDPQWILYNHVKNFCGSDGDTLCDPFMRMPSRKFYPDYYQEIKKPMSLLKIQNKIEMNHYNTLMDLAQDIHQTFENAKKYNKTESQLYKDAKQLDKVMMDKFKELEPEAADTFLEIIENEANMEEDDDDDEDDDESAADRDEEEMDDDSAASTPVMKNRGKKSISTLSVTPDSEKRKPGRPPGRPVEDTLKKRLRKIFSSVYDYNDINGRFLRPIFLGLPSRKDYPDYYKVIMEPIDLTIIENKLKADKYPNEQRLLADFELMFNNARHYNEEGSQVYQDANTLDKVIKSKWKQMLQMIKTPTSKGKTKGSNDPNPLSQKLQDLYEIVRDYQDRSGRTLSTPFIKVPNRNLVAQRANQWLHPGHVVAKRAQKSKDYPDYYEVIKRPIDMLRIQQKMTASQYDNVEEMVSDFVQVFDNACKYNEPESVIYKDALTLQRVCFQKKVELTSDCMNEVPDVKALVQELMKNLFIATYNYEDEEGRCYNDSFAELAEKDKSQPQTNGEAVEPVLTFDQIKKNLDKRRYRRVDRFQEDMFKVFERARKMSRSDSQLYEDAVEMQKFFIKTRDELCKNGELLLTPALSYMERHLSQALDKEQKEKQVLEKQEDEEKKKDDKTGEDSNNGEDECTFKDQTYSKGDFVYIQARDAPQPHIMVIETFGTDSNGQKTIKGNWFYRPHETYHVTTRKFLEKEVFRSDTCNGHLMSDILGRCCVMFVKNYFKFRPEGIPDDDVYVCESRYNVRCRSFKIIKIWQPQDSDNYNYLPRDIPLAPIRVASVFAGKESCENTLDESDTIIDRIRVSVPSETDTDAGNTYYDQLCTAADCYKLGDGVYINNPGGESLIARIDKMWTDNVGESFFHYTGFLRPSEIEHPPTRMFYKHELFQAPLEDCALIKNIVGKCCVLHIKDYCISRPTEILEDVVYITESKYHDTDRSVKRQKLIKKYTLSPKVVDDEIYFFRKPIALEKEPSPLLMKSEPNLFVDTEDSQEIEPEASNDGMSMTNEAASPIPTPSRSNKKKSVNPRRQPSGYIVFAGEVRKQIVQDNPSCSFGDISKIVGTRWRALTKPERDEFEEKAKKIGEEIAAKQQEAEKAMNESMRSPSPWSENGVAHPPPPPPQHAMPGFPMGHPGYLPHGIATHPPGHPGIPQPCPPSPVFVSLPPNSQRLMHSEAYMRYIENLTEENRPISNWDKTFNATQENTPTQVESNLPVHWLSQGAGCHGTVTNALWALRDLMMKDAYNISRTVSFEEL